MNPVINPIKYLVMNTVMNPIKDPVTNPVINSDKNIAMRPVMNQERHLLTTSGLVIILDMFLYLLMKMNLILFGQP